MFGNNTVKKVILSKNEKNKLENKGKYRSAALDVGQLDQILSLRITKISLISSTTPYYQ